MNRRIYSKKEVSIDDIINTELTAASAWHCFKECQADEFCRAFSWQHEGDGVCKLFGNDDNEDNIVAAAPTATAEQGWITGTPECSTIDLTAGRIRTPQRSRAVEISGRKTASSTVFGGG